jgi:hypothetical protein
MKKALALLSALALGAMTTVALAAPAPLTSIQMDSITAGADPTNPATGNRDWGQTTKQMAQFDDGLSSNQPGIGEHASAPPGFEPGEGGRVGVGNVSKGFDELSDGGQGLHARIVGAQMGVTPTPRR